MREMLKEWLQVYPKRGRNDIVRALENIDRNDVAAKVAIEYSSNAEPSNPSNMPLTSSPQPQGNVVTIEVPTNVVKKLKEMENKFYHLVSTMKEQLRDKLDQKKIAVLGSFCSLTLPIKHFKCSNIDELFDKLQPHLHFLNYEVLKKIDHYRYCRHDIKKYKAALKKFTKSTTVAQFKSAIERLHPSPSHDASTDTIVQLKAKDTWLDCTVHNMDCLIKYLFAEYKDSVRLVGIHHSELTIVYTVPLSVILCLITLASKRISAIRAIDIISIQIGPLQMYQVRLLHYVHVMIEGGVIDSQHSSKGHHPLCNKVACKKL